LFAKVTLFRSVATLKKSSRQQPITVKTRKLTFDRARASVKRFARVPLSDFQIEIIKGSILALPDRMETDNHSLYEIR